MLTDISQIRFYVNILIIVTVMTLTLYLVVTGYISKSKYNKLDSVQKDILRRGKKVARKNRLGKLYISVLGNKPVLIGKIVAFASGGVSENGVQISNLSIFAVRKTPFSDFIFYRVSQNEHSELRGDVKLLKWNFILSKETGFLEINTNQAYNFKLDVENNEMVDVVGNIHNTVQKAVLADPYHRKEIRRSKLIKLQNEDIVG